MSEGGYVFGEAPAEQVSPALPVAPCGAEAAVPSAISIDSITVGAGRMKAEVRLSAQAPRCTTPALARLVRKSFPDLPFHSCVNDCGPTFAAVIDRTPLPHLLEHLVIDLQTRAARHDRDVFAGTTEWVDERAGLACVQVSFTDDLVALRAFRNAALFLNECVLTLRDTPSEGREPQHDICPPDIRQTG